MFSATHNAIIEELKNLNTSNLGKSHLGNRAITNELNAIRFQILNQVSLITDDLQENLTTEVINRYFNVIKDLLNSILNLSLYNDSEFISKRDGILKELNNYKTQVLEVWASISSAKAFEISSSIENLQNTINELIIRINSETNDKEKTRLRDELQFAKERFDDEVMKQRNTLDKVLKDIKNESNKTAQEILGIKNRIEEKLKQFNDSYQIAITEIELFKQNYLIKDKLRIQATNLKLWLCAIGFLIILILLTISSFLFGWVDMKVSFCDSCLIGNPKIPYEKNFIYILFAKAFLIRAFILLFLVYILKFAIKNYNAINHNIWVFNHKNYCIDAALALTSNLKDDKKYILEFAAKEIFIQQKTGYLNNEETKIDIKLLEKLSALFKTSTSN